jgi:hypothetical protein
MPSIRPQPGMLYVSTPSVNSCERRGIRAQPHQPIYIVLDLQFSEQCARLDHSGCVRNPPQNCEREMSKLDRRFIWGALAFFCLCRQHRALHTNSILALHAARRPCHAKCTRRHVHESHACEPNCRSWQPVQRGPTYGNSCTSSLQISHSSGQSLLTAEKSGTVDPATLHSSRPSEIVEGEWLRSSADPAARTSSVAT